MSLVSEQCVDFVKSFEGFSATVYKDCVGVPTLGYGMTGKEIEGLSSVTEAQASQMLEKLLNSSYAQPIKNDLDSKGISLNQNQFDALVSMAYNVGVGSVLNSTLYKNICAGARDISTITEDFCMWDKAGGNVVQGLLRRRQAEAQMFFGIGNTIETEKVVLAQPNNFCKYVDSRYTPILDNFVTSTDNVICKDIPDNNGKTNGTIVKAGTPINIYAKCGEWYRVNNTIPQYIAIEFTKAKAPLNIIKRVRVNALEGARCYENPSKADPNNGVVPQWKELNVYKQIGNFYLVNGENQHLQWIDKDDCVDI